MDREAWCGAVHGVTKSWTWLSNWTEYVLHFSLKKLKFLRTVDSLAVRACVSFTPFHQWYHFMKLYYTITSRYWHWCGQDAEHFHHHNHHTHFPPTFIPYPLAVTSLFFLSIILSSQKYYKWNHTVTFWSWLFFTMLSSLEIHLDCCV